MKVTKFGHSCILVEENSVKILLDPGVFSTDYTDIKDVDALLITHEHQDHFDISGVKKILELNPKIKVLTNHGYC